MLVITVSIALSYFYPHAMLNAGELAKEHQQLNDKCLSCHTAFRGIPNNKCVACHKLNEIDKGLHTDTTDGSIHSLHLHLSNQNCASCHTEHQGYDYVMNAAFQHESLSPEVITNCGSCHNKPADTLHKSITASCGNCHNTSDWKLEGPFNHDLITGVDINNCSSCHMTPQDEFHQGLTAGCHECHTVDKWKPSTFDHSQYFVLDEEHNASCKTCHTRSSFLTYTCYGCHEHTESRMIAKHNEEGIYNISNCASCHKSGDEHDIRRGSEFNQRDGNNVRDYIRKQEERKKNHHDDD